MSSSVSFSKIYKAVTEARDHTAKTVKVCVVGAGPELARVVGTLSAGADDAQGGVSSALDALSPADFPRDAGLAGRWEIVVLVAAGCPAAEAAPVASAVHAAGLQLIALVEEQDGGAWARAAGVFDDEIARGVGGDHKGAPSLEKKIVRVAGDRRPPWRRSCRPCAAPTATTSSSPTRRRTPSSAPSSSSPAPTCRR